ncbi:VOC family protein [Deinococcus radiomollis]|uniref:VOC family protein n=1 Tax=Deinococcus radiomollis TaxID=468916 RepID=UPI003891FB98
MTASRQVDDVGMSASTSASQLGSTVSPVLALGAVILTVADLARSVAYYRQAIGLRVLEQSEGRALLGAGTTALVELREQKGAVPSSPRHTGLYHLAILLPSRADLGRFVSHLMTEQLAVQGASDHLVSEALYLQDPDGHGIEVYADRDAAGWEWQNGQVQMGTLAADIAGIVASAGEDTAWRGLPESTVMGHVHLKVDDLSRARAFYEGLLGLDVVVDFSRQGALFVSQGGYHHHFGLNVWHSRDGTAAQDGEARLLSAQVYLPAAELEVVRGRLLLAGYAAGPAGEPFAVSDPAGNLLHFSLRS